MSNWLDAAWMQRGLDALRDTLDVNADVKRQMIEFLFDSGLWDRSKLTYDAAVTKFNANMNPEKAGNWKQSEIWALMRRFERYQLFYAMADDFGFEVRKKATTERVQELLERIAKCGETYNRTIAECGGDLRRLGSGGAELRIHPRIAAGEGSFAFRGEDDTTGGF